MTATIHPLTRANATTNAMLPRFEILSLDQHELSLETCFLYAVVYRGLLCFTVDEVADTLRLERETVARHVVARGQGAEGPPLYLRLSTEEAMKGIVAVDVAVAEERVIGEFSMEEPLFHAFGAWATDEPRGYAPTLITVAGARALVPTGHDQGRELVEEAITAARRVADRWAASLVERAVRVRTAVAASEGAPS